MKVLVAPNAFKESLNSIDVAHYISCGLMESSKKIEVIELPLADGGTGTCRIITRALDGNLMNRDITGPKLEKVTATYGFAPKQHVAIIELAEAAGLAIIPKKERDPMITTTIGVGELILDAVKKRYNKIILGIGDSSTIDCGIGALSVFGVRFLNRQEESIDLNCVGLLDLYKIDCSAMKNIIRTAKITIASDVHNILTGKHGALVYARQKGAKPSNIPVIAKALRRFRKVLLDQFKVDIDKIPGSGAAGGIGGSFVAILNAQIISGFGLVKELTYFEDAVKSCDIVITGEGRIDNQSFSGKTLERVLIIAGKYKKPVVLVCGHIRAGTNMLRKYNIKGKYALSRSVKSLDKAMVDAPKLLEKTAKRIAKDLFE